MTFQEQLERLRGEGTPLPLLPGQAVAQAVRLRARGMTYPGIAAVMEMYHGAVANPGTWRERCRNAGAAPKHHTNGLRLPPARR